MSVDPDSNHAPAEATAHALVASPVRVDRYRARFDDAADAMLILEDQRLLGDANRAAGVLVGVAPRDLVGQRLDVFLSRDDQEQLDTCWRELLAFGEAKRAPRLETRQQGVRLVECSYRAAVQGGGHVCIARDITDRRLLEARLVHAERIESIGRLAGGIHVLEAADATEACALFAEHGSQIALLVTEVVMPGMSGPTLAEHLVGQRADLRVLFISGYVDGESPLDGALEHAGFLNKPFPASVLSSKVRELIGSLSTV